MIKWIMNDFKSVRANLSYFTGKNIPIGIAILYYVVIGLLALPLMPFIYVWYKIQMRKMEKLIKELKA